MQRKPAIRVRTANGKPREWTTIRKDLGGHSFIRVYPQPHDGEFIITADSPKQLGGIRAGLPTAGLEEMVGGDTCNATSPSSPPVRRGDLPQRSSSSHHPHTRPPPARSSPFPDLTKKPYGFVALPKELATSAPIWHDGASSEDRLTGEIRFELRTLTPLLVGWERRALKDVEGAWAVPFRKVPRAECKSVVEEAARHLHPDASDADEDRRARNQQKAEQRRREYLESTQDHVIDVKVQGAGWSIDSKSVLCPLRAEWDERPVIIPGDSLKGLLRHELGALLGAPMERVAERSYSYRPNAAYPKETTGRYLVPRLARVPRDSVKLQPLDDGHEARVPTRLELFPAELEYNKKAKRFDYFFDQGTRAHNYRGGQGAGEKLFSKVRVHTSLTLRQSESTEIVDVPATAQQGYLDTLRHLIDADGHFAKRHPDVQDSSKGDEARCRIFQAAKNDVFHPGDFVWVEWDTKAERIVSLGWHYYYRWAYTDSVRKDADAPRLERHGLFPLDAERKSDSDGAPSRLSPVRRLFGYVGDDEGSAGIGEGNHAQLMGRVFVNAGLEVVAKDEPDNTRFLAPTFLKELGLPRPSAVEHYLQQPHHPKLRPSDRAKLATYGDATGYDEPGELAGRKFYLDRKDAYSGAPWEDATSPNRLNERSTLALEASKRGRTFRFTVRFRDLDATELAAILVALCPEQFKRVLGGTHAEGYCSKLGYARPLGWGSVRIEAKGLLLLDDECGTPALRPEADLESWVERHHQKTETQDAWLAIHRRHHPDAADYPRKSGEVYTFHTSLRADHSRDRRYKR